MMTQLKSRRNWMMAIGFGMLALLGLLAISGSAVLADEGKIEGIQVGYSHSQFDCGHVSAYIINNSPRAYMAKVETVTTNDGQMLNLGLSKETDAGPMLVKKGLTAIDLAPQDYVRVHTAHCRDRDGREYGAMDFGGEMVNDQSRQWTASFSQPVTVLVGIYTNGRKVGVLSLTMNGHPR